MGTATTGSPVSLAIAFAVPIDVASHVKQELVAHGRVERGRLGVHIQEVTQSLAESFGLDRPRGALVAQVEKDSPAAKAGIKPGDVLPCDFAGKATVLAEGVPLFRGAFGVSRGQQCIRYEQRIRRPVHHGVDANLLRRSS